MSKPRLKCITALAAASIASVTLADRFWIGTGEDKDWATSDNWTATEGAFVYGGNGGAERKGTFTTTFSSYNGELTNGIWVENKSSADSSEKVTWTAADGEKGLHTTQGLTVGTGMPGELEITEGKFDVDGQLRVGDGTGRSILTVSGGTVTSVGDIFVGNNANAVATLTISGTGNVVNNRGQQKWFLMNGTSTVNLEEGGTLSLWHIQCQSNAEKATVNFNGGTLEQVGNTGNCLNLIGNGNAGDNQPTVNINENGGFIYADAANLKNPDHLGEIWLPADMKGVGTITKIGSSRMTLSGKYFGGLDVDKDSGEVTTPAGASLAAESSNFLASGFVSAIPVDKLDSKQIVVENGGKILLSDVVLSFPEEGDLQIASVTGVTIDGTIVEDGTNLGGAIEVAGATVAHTLYFSGNKIYAAPVTTVNVWQGGENAAWSSADSWSEGVPTGPVDVAFESPATVSITGDAVAATVALGGDVTFVENGGNSTLSFASVTGEGAFIKAGDGMTTLAGALSGNDLTVSSGILTIPANSNVGALAIGANAALVIDMTGLEFAAGSTVNLLTVKSLDFGGGETINDAIALAGPACTYTLSTAPGADDTVVIIATIESVGSGTMKVCGKVVATAGNPLYFDQPSAYWNNAAPGAADTVIATADTQCNGWAGNTGNFKRILARANVTLKSGSGEPNVRAAFVGGNGKFILSGHGFNADSGTMVISAGVTIESRNDNTEANNWIGAGSNSGITVNADVICTTPLLVRRNVTLNGKMTGASSVTFDGDDIHLAGDNSAFEGSVVKNNYAVHFDNVKAGFPKAKSVAVYGTLWLDFAEGEIEFGGDFKLESAKWANGINLPANVTDVTMVVGGNDGSVSIKTGEGFNDYCAYYPPEGGGWAAGTDKFTVRKIGSGTMANELRSLYNFSAEGGMTSFDRDSTAVVTVAEGAAIGGGATIGSVTFAEGAIVRQTLVEADGVYSCPTLTVNAAVDATGVVFDLAGAETYSSTAQAFTLLKATSVTGLAEVTDSEPENGYFWRRANTGTAVTLTRKTEAPVATDANGIEYASIAEAIAGVAELDDKSITVLQSTGEDIVLPGTGYKLELAEGVSLTGKVAAAAGYGVKIVDGAYEVVDNSASEWVGATGGAWKDAANWSTGVIPSKYTDVTFPAEFTGTVYVTADGWQSFTDDAETRGVSEDANGRDICRSMTVDGVVTLQRGETPAWCYLSLFGGISGEGALKLNRVGLENQSGVTQTVSCDVEVLESNGDSYLTAGAMDFTGTLTVGGLLNVFVPVTVSNVVFKDKADLIVGENGSLALAGATVDAGAAAKLTGAADVLAIAGTITVGDGATLDLPADVTEFKADAEFALGDNATVNIKQLKINSGAELVVSGSESGRVLMQNNVGGGGDLELGVAGAEGSAGTLTMKGGFMTVGVHGNAKWFMVRNQSVINLDGGELAICRFTPQGDGFAATLNFNGGKLSSYANGYWADSMLDGNGGWTVAVKDGGAVFSIPADFETKAEKQLVAAEGSTGGIVKLGEGTFVLESAPQINGEVDVQAGVLYVKAGAALSLADETAKVETDRPGYDKFVAKAKVASVGGIEFSSLAKAVAAAKDGETVSLLAEVTLDARVEPNLGADKTLTIDLGGYTVTREGTSGNGSAFDVKSGTVVIKNGTIDCSQDDADIVKNGVYAITARSGATVTLEELEITVDSQAGACAYPFNGAKVTIKSGTYINLTEVPYQYKPGWTGMAVNQDNVATQLLFIEGGAFSKVNPALGDDSGKVATFLATGYAATYDTENGVWVVAEQKGYSGGAEDKTFTITEDVTLPEGKTLADIASAASGITYAQAYVLGLLNKDGELEKDVTPTIKIVDGKIVVSLDAEVTGDYKVMLNVYEKASFTDEWPAQPTKSYELGSKTAFDQSEGGAGFFKVSVTIEDAQQ